VFRSDRTLGMVGSAATLDALRAGAPLPELQERWARDSAEFMAQRARALLYPD
jgi:hypothetical protein